jgi:hypothetical protein
VFQKSKQKMTIYEKELEDLTFNVRAEFLGTRDLTSGLTHSQQLKTRLAEAKKKNEELNRLIHNKANHEAKAAWDKTSDRREPPWRSSHRKEGGEPILQLHKKISSALERSDQHQSAQTQGPGSGTFDEGFKDATIAHQLLFNKIRERLPWEYVLEFLREEVPEGEIGDESDD